jgi:SAM-dependent methyltransferase
MVRDMYSHLFEYICVLPSFHVGYDSATSLQTSLLSPFSVGRDSHILELCCGLGQSMRRLVQEYECQVTGLDLNHRQTVECMRRNSLANTEGDARAVCGNAAMLPFKDESFDIVWSEDSFSHVPTRQQLLVDVARVLKQSGGLVFFDLVRSDSMPTESEAEFCRAWCLAPLETEHSYLAKLDEVGFSVHRTISAGRQLLEHHVALEESSGDGSPAQQKFWLDTNADSLAGAWGESGLQIRRERSRMYEYISSGLLDCVFFAAQKA